MLFRCLHQMELDTGPWTRKSSILCSLLLLATFSVLQVTGQTEIVGLGNHTLLKDGKVNLNMGEDYTYIGVKNINSTEYKKRFPGACDVTIKDDLIEIEYKGELCTVDLLSDLKDTIKFKAGVRDSGGIDKCLGKGSDFKDSRSNLLPFIYSKSNSVIKNFNTEPNKGNKGCSKDCEDGCWEWTSLEVSWSRNREYFFAHTHLIRENKPSWWQTKDFKEDGSKMTFDLDINKEGMFKMNFAKDGNYYNPSEEAVCAPTNNTIIKPVAWTINNTLLKNEYLLVFSMLSLNASYVKDFTGKKPSKPKCELFIQFNTTYYRLLTVIPPPTTTTSTTIQTTMTTTTEAPSTTQCPTIEFPTTTCPTTTCPTTTCPADKKCLEESKKGLIVSLVIGWLLFVFMLFVVGILTWFLIKKTDNEKEVKKPEKSEEKGLRSLYDAEVKKKGPAAVGTFDKWKENRKKNVKTAVQGLPPKKDGNTANKKKAVKEEKHAKTKNDIVQEKYEKEWYQYVYNSEYLPELKKKGIAVVGTFDEWKKNRPPPATVTLIEQSPMTKTAMGTDKSVVDKGKSSTGVDGKKSATVEDIVQPFAEDPVIPDPPKKAEKVKDEEWTLEEYEYDDDGNLLPKVNKGGIECPPSTESEHTPVSI